MKKTALLSVHSDPNYGSMLQAYALSAVLNKLGCENEYISYEPHKKQNVLVVLIKQLVKYCLILLRIKKTTKTEYSYWKTPEFKKQKELFNQFHVTNIPTSDKKYYSNTISEANDVYKQFVIGSDQTWSPLLSSNPNSISFLPFVVDKSKKTSYAPSIGTTHINDEYLQILKNKLSTFKNLSCREYSNAQLLTSYLGRKVEFVLDPTLLLTKEEWMKLSEPIELPKQFVLCYILGVKKSIYEYASKLAKIKNLPLYIIVTRPEYLSYKNALKDVSVGQFLSLINQASYVVTDSFHGSIFSINLGTNFYAFAKREVNNGYTDNDRIMDFLSCFHIEDRFIADNDNRIPDDLDYSIIEGALSEMKTNSINYLISIIK